MTNCWFFLNIDMFMDVIWTSVDITKWMTMVNLKISRIYIWPSGAYLWDRPIHNWIRIGRFLNLTGLSLASTTPNHNTAIKLHPLWHTHNAMHIYFVPDTIWILWLISVGMWNILRCNINIALNVLTNVAFFCDPPHLYEYGSAELRLWDINIHHAVLSNICI